MMTGFALLLTQNRCLQLWHRIDFASNSLPKPSPACAEDLRTLLLPQ
jgi:hypothetical protein